MPLLALQGERSPTRSTDKPQKGKTTGFQPQERFPTCSTAHPQRVTFVTSFTGTQHPLDTGPTVPMAPGGARNTSPLESKHRDAVVCLSDRVSSLQFGGTEHLQLVPVLINLSSMFLE